MGPPAGPALLLLLLGVAAAEIDCSPCLLGPGPIAALIVADIIMTLLIAGGAYCLAGRGQRGKAKPRPPEMEATYQPPPPRRACAGSAAGATGSTSPSFLSSFFSQHGGGSGGGGGGGGGCCCFGGGSCRTRARTCFSDGNGGGGERERSGSGGGGERGEERGGAAEGDGGRDGAVRAGGAGGPHPRPPRGGRGDLGRAPRHPRPAPHHRHQHLPAGAAEPGSSSRRRRHRRHPHRGPPGAIRGPSCVTAAATHPAAGLRPPRPAALRGAAGAGPAPPPRRHGGTPPGRPPRPPPPHGPPAPAAPPRPPPPHGGAPATPRPRWGRGPGDPPDPPGRRPPPRPGHPQNQPHRHPGGPHRLRAPPGQKTPGPAPAPPGPALAPPTPRPRRPRPPDPPFLPPEVGAEPAAEDKKKGRGERLKRCIRTAAGSSWEDPSLLEWDADDFRIFCGDLGNEVNDDILGRAFGRYPSFLKAKVIRDKRTGKTKGYGFVSFKDPNDYVRAMREMNGKYVGSRPIKLRKSMWKDRNLEVVRRKQREKKKLGLR